MGVMKVSDLIPLAVQYRALAVTHYPKNMDEYERLETRADELYAKARDEGLTFFEVPRFDPKVKSSKELTCVQCGGGFLAERSTAKYCSKSCRQRFNYEKRV